MVLVDGVTGSGKTEVYLAAIERVLAHGRSACVLVPEIRSRRRLLVASARVSATRWRCSIRAFPRASASTSGIWSRSGAARVVVGARSALFCPLADLGLIVIDEEHEQSYKQGSSPRYHAREVAAKLAQLHGCALVLGSATPSAEALARCEAGGHGGARWTRVEMPERPGTRAPSRGSSLPT
ncbi:MAG: DEAD/DEAH box helicase [Collinsella sp.]